MNSTANICPRIDAYCHSGHPRFGSADDALITLAHQDIHHLDGSSQDSLRRELLVHPHFYPIFSRHGGNGSTAPYPHADLRPWVEQVIEHSGWDRILWGSEYPVLFWRNESLADAQMWLQALLPDSTNPRLDTFLGGNAERIIFAQTPPAREPVTLPHWIDAQFDRERTVPLFENGGLAIPMTLYGTLHHSYVTALEATPHLRFAQFIENILENSAKNATQSTRNDSSQ